MLRTLWFLGMVVLISLSFTFLAGSPSHVSLDWLGYRVNTTIPMLASMIMGFSLIVVLIFRFWLLIKYAPKSIANIIYNKKRGRGYKALTAGMVAVAAGDSEEALKQAKLAEILLNDPPLTMLLSAQAAQLNGDERAAREFFLEMTKRNEMEFLGLRGLITQAKKEGDLEESLNLIRRANLLRPKSGWVSKNLFDLQIKNRCWHDASVTNQKLVKIGMINKSSSLERNSILSYQIGLDALSQNNNLGAYREFKRAYELDPTFIPGVASFVKELIHRGQNSKAQNALEKTWKIRPHPHLVALYWEALETQNPMDRIKASQGLLKINPEHCDSHIAVIKSALDAKLWGEARKHLEIITSSNEDEINSQVCRFWAELEKLENGDIEKTQNWLMRASRAVSPETWVCGVCGIIAKEWLTSCSNCKHFNSFSWSLPSGAAKGAKLKKFFHQNPRNNLINEVKK